MADGFWNSVLTAKQATSMLDKYAWLRRLVLEGAAPAGAGALREAARRWPGSLRECQRVEPALYRARETALRDSLAASPRSFRRWRAVGHAGICLWSELHGLHADVLGWRTGRPLRRHPAAFLRDLTASDPERRAAWPAGEVVQAWSIATVGTALAELALAHRAGLDRAALRVALLGRPGR